MHKDTGLWQLRRNTDILLYTHDSPRIDRTDTDMNLARTVRLPTVAEQELQVGHVHLPAGDAIALRQRQSDPVDVLLQGPSRIGGRREGERKHVTSSSTGKAHGDCSPAGREHSPYSDAPWNSGTVLPSICLPLSHCGAVQLRPVALSRGRSVPQGLCDWTADILDCHHGGRGGECRWHASG